MKNPSYGKNVDFALLLVRIAAAGLMLYGHGYPKLLNISSGDMQFADPLGIGVQLSLMLAFMAEFICTLFILFGFVPRLASIPLIINMLVIIFAVHIGDGFARLETPLFYLLSYLVILVAGGGRYSIHGMILPKNK